jgi:hypothetical protein
LKSERAQIQYLNYHITKLPNYPIRYTENVPRKKKRKTFSATAAVKAASRAVLGTPPPVQRQTNKKRTKREKHKPTLGRLLSSPD